MQGWGPRRRAVPPAHTENLAQPVTYNSGFVRRVCAGGLCGHGLSTALQCPHGGGGGVGRCGVALCPGLRRASFVVCVACRWVKQVPGG